MPEKIDKKTLKKNLYLTNKSFEIFNIEALRKAKYLEKNYVNVKTQHQVKEISDEIHIKSWKRIDSLALELTKNYDTIQINEALKQELEHLEKKDSIHPLDYFSPRPMR